LGSRLNAPNRGWKEADAMKYGKSMSSLGVTSLLVICLLVVGIEPTQSQPKYPTKPIDLIVAFPPGGASDTATRILAPYLEKKWGVRVNVINKPGGNSIPAVLEILGARPDGYTLLSDCQSSYTMLHFTLKEVPFKPTDRTVLAMWGASPSTIFVYPTSPFKSLKDLEMEARRDPESFTWTSHGGPAPQDYFMKLFFRTIGVDFAKTKAVMVKGGAQAIVMVAGNHVKLGSTAISITVPAHNAGNIRIVAVGADKRWPALPDIPTVQEAGYKNLNYVPWFGIAGPLKLPAHVIEVWDKTLQEISKDEEIVQKMRNAGVTPYYYKANDAKEYLLKEIEEGKIAWGSN
jgi:tripartite-type tricarboxylate transporter receptor subunit TctC